MEPHKFKKPGGGRGRPSPSSLCAECGIIWTDHPKVTVVVKPKRVKKSVS
ncbi:hypothetical protein IIC38_09785, partial [candidate division KSB1 bacterium]|nr:hypothetical protein [candidate division KSB1 bacterium]